MRSPFGRTSWSFLLGGAVTLLVSWPLVHAETQANSGDDRRMRYARARMALAETSLQQVEAMNSRVRGVVSSNAVNEYRRDVEVARRHLESLQTGRPGDDLRLWIRRAEANYEAAKAQWKSAKAVNARVRGALDPLEVRRLELQAEVGQLLVEQGKGLAGGPREDQVSWQLEVLASETQRLNEEVQRAHRPSGDYPYYWY